MGRGRTAPNEGCDQGCWFSAFAAASHDAVDCGNELRNGCAACHLHSSKHAERGKTPHAAADLLQLLHCGSSAQHHTHQSSQLRLRGNYRRCREAEQGQWQSHNFASNAHIALSTKIGRKATAAACRGSGLKTLGWSQGLERLQHRHAWSYATLCCSCALGMITPKPCDLQEKGGEKEGSAAKPRLETRDAQQRVGLGKHAAPNSAHVLCLCPTARQLQHTGVEKNPRRTAHLRRYRTFIKPSALSV